MLFKPLMVVAVAVGAASAQSATASTCKAVQIFLMMGHGETFPGNQQSIAKAVCNGRSSCAYSNFDYPATSTGDYCVMASKAISTAMTDLTNYVIKCPDSKIVLSAWSQGAWYLTDVLAGGGGIGKGLANGCTQPNSTALSPTTSPGKNVVAVAVYGDPRHTANQSFNVGTAANKDGVWPRQGEQLAAENLWASKLHSYCAAGDPACANGSDWNAHGGYFGSYAATPAAWINSMLNAAS